MESRPTSTSYIPNTSIVFNAGSASSFGSYLTAPGGNGENGLSGQGGWVPDVPGLISFASFFDAVQQADYPMMTCGPTAADRCTAAGLLQSKEYGASLRETWFPAIPATRMRAGWGAWGAYYTGASTGTHYDIAYNAGGIGYGAGGGTGCVYYSYTYKYHGNSTSTGYGTTGSGKGGKAGELRQATVILPSQATIAVTVGSGGAARPVWTYSHYSTNSSGVYIISYVQYNPDGAGANGCVAIFW